MKHLLSRLTIHFSLAGLLSLTLFFWPVWPALADTFTVNFTPDGADLSPGDGKCDAFSGFLFPGDQCTLRAAIQESNALAGADTIILPEGVYTLTINGNNDDASATGDLDISDLVTLTGAGAETTIVQGEPGWDDRIFQITTSGKATFSQITVQNGLIDGNIGGGILNSGILTLTHGIVTNNKATNGGGGIANSDVADKCSLALIDSAVISNTSISYHGGGIFVDDGTFTALNSLISYNKAGMAAGGIMSNCGTTLTLTNTTISTNQANSDSGGLEAACLAGKTSLNNVMIVNNIADADNNNIGEGGGMWINTGTLTFANTVIAGNKKGSSIASDCFSQDSSYFTSQGYNLIQTTANCTISGNSTGNIIGQNPLLGPLQDNGGSTLTHAPLPGSPAIDTGNPAVPGSGGNACAATDQRGVARPIGPRCDMGAVEVLYLGVYLPLVLK